jgi:hypothetical protein
MIAVQVALTLLMLTAAGAAGKGFLRLVNTDLGYDPHQTMALPIPIHENTYVSFRAGQFLYLALAAATAAAIDAARAWSAPRRIAFAVAAVVASLAALPTSCSTPTTPRTSPTSGRRRRLRGRCITPAQGRARCRSAPTCRATPSCRWIRRAHGRATWALLPAFGERRMAVGLALFEPNPHRFDRPMADVGKIFSAGDTASAFALCERFGITTLWVGPEERAAHGDAAADKFMADPAHFSPVYAAAGVTIYRVGCPSHPSGAHR